MTCLYNEWDQSAAAWLRQLVQDGLITPGTVDERSITDINADELGGFSRIHWFAGIGGWDYALQLAKWRADQPVWTANLPCQPFSAAGKQLGKADERHLLPHFIELVRGAKPGIIFGEQVPGAIGHGWLDDLCDHLEGEGYTVRAAVLSAAGQGAPHIRARLYWVAYRDSFRRNGWEATCGQKKGACTGINSRCATGRLADHAGTRHEKQPDHAGIPGQAAGDGTRQNAHGSSGLGDAKHNGHIASAISGSDTAPVQNDTQRQDSAGEFTEASTSRNVPEWTNLAWLPCRDGKHRPVKPGLKPLVNGIPPGMVRGGNQGAPLNAEATGEARVMRLKGYGNAIVPQVAAMFIQAVINGD